MPSNFDALIDTAIGDCMQAFGEPVVYTAPGGRLPQNIVGVFDRAYQELLPMGGANGQEGMQLGAAPNITAARPMLGVQMSQFHSPPEQGATVCLTTRGNALYIVREVRPDGRGGARLLLSLA